MLLLSIFRNPLQHLVSVLSIVLAAMVTIVSWVCLLPKIAANAAAQPTTPIAEFRIGCILGRKSMTPDAMFFGRLFPAKNVFVKRDGLKVIWIDAFSHAAKVIQYQVIGNWSSDNFPREHVGEQVFPIKTQVSVSLIVQSPNPKPAASCLEYLRVERFVDTANVRHCGLNVRPESATAPGEIPSADIFPIGARLKVIRVDALRDPAFMVQRQTVQNRTVDQFIRKPMGVISFAITCKRAMARIVDVSDPKPACSGLQNPLVESFIKRERTGHSLNQYAAHPHAMKWETST